MSTDGTDTSRRYRGFEGLDGGDVPALDALVRSLEPEDRLFEAPPTGIWDDIAAELDLPIEGDVVTKDDGVSTRDEPTPLTPSNVRALPRWVPILGAAAALALIAGAVGVFASRTDGPDSTTVLATAELEPLVEGFAGVAFFENDGEQLDLRLELGGLPPGDDGFYELWIIKDLETGQMQSLGPISGSGIVAWPEGFDPNDYSVVDISVEPRDGVPTHSGASVLRGELRV